MARLLSSKLTAFSLTIALILVAVVLTAPTQAASSRLADRSLKLGQNLAGETTRYVFGFRSTNNDPIQMVELEICANDPLPENPCVPPAGFDASGAQLVSQTGDVGYTLSAESTANVLVLERSPQAANQQYSEYTFGGIVNPTDNGSYYIRLQTFSDADRNGLATGYGGIAFAITDNIDVTVTVPPYLLMCTGVTIGGYNCNDISGSYVDFGELSSRQVSQGSTQVLAATNAIDGYTLRVFGTTLTAGNHVIPAMAGADISRPGASQFGMNLRANTSPAGGADVNGPGGGVPVNGYGQVNFYRFNSGDIIARSMSPDDARKYTVTYIVNVGNSQAPGIYVSTLTYLALGSF